MPELQDIFAQYGEAYHLAHPLSPEQRKVVRAIQSCRTAALGGHVDECDECGFIRVSYNSCRNRHCPKCQTLTKERWIEARKNDLLNVGYFYVVFTVPDLVNPVAYQNPRVVYGLIYSRLPLKLCRNSQVTRNIWGLKLDLQRFFIHGDKTSCTIPICTALFPAADSPLTVSG